MSRGQTLRDELQLAAAQMIDAFLRDSRVELLSPIECRPLVVLYSQSAAGRPLDTDIPRTRGATKAELRKHQHQERKLLQYLRTLDSTVDPKVEASVAALCSGSICTRSVAKLIESLYRAFQYGDNDVLWARIHDDFWYLTAYYAR